MLHDCPLTGAQGWITGPVDVGGPDGGPRLLDGAELVAWLAEQEAPGVSVTSAD